MDVVAMFTSERNVHESNDDVQDYLEHAGSF